LRKRLRRNAPSRTGKHGGWYGGGSVLNNGSVDDDRGGGESGYVLTATSEKTSGYALGEEFYLT
jgi:hypothetical protein